MSIRADKRSQYIIPTFVCLFEFIFCPPHKQALNKGQHDSSYEMVSITSDTQELFLSIEGISVSLPVYLAVRREFHFAKIIKCLFLGFFNSNYSDCKRSCRNIAIIQVRILIFVKGRSVASLQLCAHQ